MYNETKMGRELDDDLQISLVSDTATRVRFTEYRDLTIPADMSWNTPDVKAAPPSSLVRSGVVAKTHSGRCNDELCSSLEVI